MPKQQWTSEEDDALAQAVQEIGAKNWAKIALKVATRTSKQCRDRWRTRLDPDLRTGPWTKSEDKKIMQLVSTHGFKWSVLAQLLPGRSSSAIKNRYHGCLKRRFDPELEPSSDERKSDSESQPDEPTPAIANNENPTQDTTQNTDEIISQQARAPSPVIYRIAVPQQCHRNCLSAEDANDAPLPPFSSLLQNLPNSNQY